MAAQRPRITMEIPASTDSPLLVFTSITGADAAQALAEALIELRLAACVQIETIRSVYRWQGQICHGEEQRLLIKTRRALWPALQQAILARHSDTLPALYALEPAEMLAPFADWLRAETTSPAQ